MEGEYAEFQAEVARRRWTQLTKLMAKYDPKVVMEFYANAWSTKEGVMDKLSWVRGQWIPYDIDATNQFLGHPLVLEEGPPGPIFLLPILTPLEFSKKESPPQIGAQLPSRTSKRMELP